MDKNENTARSVGLEDYSGSITIRGRNLITSLLAGETITFTRIIVGSGRMPDDVDIWDMTDLVTPVAEATSTIPTVEGGVMSMIVEYRNDMNGGLAKGFWLQEFGIYAKTDKSDEVLLYYAAMGDSPQPVNPYKDNRIDIRRYPVFIELFIDANVQVSYNPGAFVTAAEAEELIRILVRDIVRNVRKNVTIPCDGWQYSLAGGMYTYHTDIPVEGMTEDMIPSLTIPPEGAEAALDCGFCHACETRDGALRIWSKSIPATEVPAVLTLADGNFGDFPINTVKVGNGLKITNDGTLSLDTATGAEVAATLMGSNTENGEE